MRLINAGSVGFEAVSIDDHQLTVIANDFVPVQAYNVDHVILAVGQRIDVVFTANGSPGQSYWLRAWNDPLCGQTQGPDGRGIIAYTGADTSAEPTSTGTAAPPNTSCTTDDLSHVVPVYSAPVVEPDVTITITITPRPDSSGVFRWFMNNVSFQGNTGTPLIVQAITEDSTAFPPERNVYDLGSNKTIRVILQNTFQAPHPMHLHGHDFQVLAQGPGTWDGTITNPSNPNRRDVQMLWGGTAVPSYTVLQWYQDNPGIWPLRKFRKFRDVLY
jgi:FtsP/CotA-like multicopper oxidase with cupredoxin domain